MIFSISPLLLFIIVVGVTSTPHLDYRARRSPRSAGYTSSGSGNSGASAFSSSSTSYFPGPGGSGSFSAKAGHGVSHQPTPSFIRGSGTYASNYDYGKDYVHNSINSNYPAHNYGGGSYSGAGPPKYSGPSFGSSYSPPVGYGGGYGGGYGYGGYGGGCNGCASEGGFGGYREGGSGSGFAGSAGAGSFAGSGTGGFGGPSGNFASSGGFPSNFGYGGFPFPQFTPFDFTSLMQQHFANAAAQQEFIRNQAQAHGVDASSNDVGGVGANAFGQLGPQGGFGAANVYPAPEGGVDERFGGGDRTSSPNSGPVSSVSGTFPAPQGAYQGISTFSSSGQSDVNGKKTSYKTSSVSVNDNGKVTTYTAHDP